MDKRIRLIEPNDKVQIIAKKGVSDKDRDCITIIVYGYTDTMDYVEFNYDIEFLNEFNRDKQFDEITEELILEDVTAIVKASCIPMVL